MYRCEACSLPLGPNRLGGSGHVVCDRCHAELVKRPVPAPPTPPRRPLMTVSEAAAWLHVSPETVRVYIADGRLAAKVVGHPRKPNGRRYRLRMHDVLALLTEHVADVTTPD